MAFQKQRLFPTQLTWQWSIHMIKVLWCRFQQWFSTFTMLLVKGSFQKGLFRHLYDDVFGVLNFGNTKSMTVFFFWKYLKFLIDSKNGHRISEKVFCFWDNCIWIGIVKLSLLRTGFFSLAANVLTSSPKIWYVKKTKTFSNSIDLAVINEYDRDAVIQISTVVPVVYHVACRRVLWNGTF